MGLAEKVTAIKQMINLICDVIPTILNIVKEVITTLHEIKTA